MATETGTGGAPAAPASLGLNEPDDVKRAGNWKAEHDASTAAMVTEFLRVQAANQRMKDYMTDFAATVADALKVSADSYTDHTHIV